jgi:hypothetical protein
MRENRRVLSVAFLIIIFFIPVFFLRFFRKENFNRSLPQQTLVSVQKISRDTFLDVSVNLPYPVGTDIDRLSAVVKTATVYLYNTNSQHAYHSVGPFVFVYNPASEDYGTFGNRFFPIGNIPSGNYLMFLSLDHSPLIPIGNQLKPIYLENGTTNTIPNTKIPLSANNALSGILKSKQQNSFVTYCSLIQSVNTICIIDTRFGLYDDGIVAFEIYQQYLQAITVNALQSL